MFDTSLYNKIIINLQINRKQGWKVAAEKNNSSSQSFVPRLHLFKTHRRYEKKKIS